MRSWILFLGRCWALHTRKRGEISRILYTHTPKVPLACHLITFNSAWGLKYEKMPWFQVHFIRWDPNVSIEIHLKKKVRRKWMKSFFLLPSLCIHVNFFFLKFVQNLTPNHSQPNLELNPTAIQMVWQHSNEWIFYGSLNAILELSIISQAILHIWWQSSSSSDGGGQQGFSPSSIYYSLAYFPAWNFLLKSCCLARPNISAPIKILNKL